jgi:hypothetical protein
MEDVIDVMEELLTKVVETENRRNQSQIPDNIINLNLVKNKDDGVEIIVLDDSLPKAFECPSGANMQVDPLKIDMDSIVIKKEPLLKVVDCNELIHNLDTEEGAMEKLDAIDLAMEVVEEIIVEEVIVGNELDQTDSIDHKADAIKVECEEQIIDIRDGRSKKLEVNDNGCPQLIDIKVETSGGNGNEEDGDDEHEDDEYDDEGDDEEDEEEEGKDIKRDKLLGENDMKSENKGTKLLEQQPEGEEAVNVITEVTVNRRSSQESTTTTTTTTTTETSTADSSCSSSDSEDDSSSSNDSSNSSSNSDSDSVSDAMSDEAKQTHQTMARATSVALTSKTKSEATLTSKSEDKRDSNGDDEHDAHQGMYGTANDTCDTKCGVYGTKQGLYYIAL